VCVLTFDESSEGTKSLSGEAGSAFSKHFHVERLANGVYAAIHVDGGWAIGNAGIVDLGERTLVFDTGLTPQAACDLHSAAEVLTGRVPNYVVNSHYHNDHIRGNQVFPEAVVVSTLRTRELIATKGKTELEADRKDAPERLAAMRTLAQSEDPENQRLVALFLPYWQGILASLPDIQLRLPELAFEGQLTFHGTARTAHLVEVGGGHTKSDCVLFLPHDKALFCGDLLFVRCHPYLGDGDPQAWLSVLDRLESLVPEVYVPGHGPVGEREDLRKMQLYIRTLMQRAEEVVARGGTEEDAAGQPVCELFADWILGQPFHEANMRFLYSRLAREG